MSYEISAPAKIQTTIQLPASKSISNRVLIIHALCHGENSLLNLSECDDTNVMIQALSKMPDEINIQAAGTAMRFLTAYLSIQDGTHVITGTERMQHRPIEILVEALRSLGAHIDYMKKEGFPPLRIEGQSEGNWKDVIQLPGNVSSQYVSALMMIAPYLPKGLTIKLTGNVVSRPYIQLTLEIMREHGAKAEWIGENLITIAPHPYQDIPYIVENDWSAASYWYEIAALASSSETEIVLPQLYKHSYQGDSEVIWIFEQLGIYTSFNPDNSISIKRFQPSPTHFEYDFVNQPDLAQTLVVTCAMLNIPFYFTGLQSLKIKETDRITALIHEMKKLGYVLKEESGSILFWEGERCEASLEPIDTYEDHRMAMAFAPASLIVPNLQINHPEVVSKSYPRYWDDLRKAGFIIKEK